MATARPLRDVFADVPGDEAARASDPAELLRSSGHEDLPDTLVAEAVTSYADTAPLEVAEHLARYVMANSAVPGVATEVDPSGWLEVLAGAPEMLDSTVDPAAAGLDEEPRHESTDDGADEAFGATVDADDAFDLDFGLGEALDAVVAQAVELLGAASTPEAGDDAFGAVAPGAGDEAFGGAAGPDAGDGAFGAAADLPGEVPLDEADEGEEPADDAGG